MNPKKSIPRYVEIKMAKIKGKETIFLFFSFWPPCSIWSSGTGIISEPELQLKPQLWQCWILTPLYQAGGIKYVS